MNIVDIHTAEEKERHKHTLRETVSSYTRSGHNVNS
jgi:hypothetical protein